MGSLTEYSCSCHQTQIQKWHSDATGSLVQLMFGIIWLRENLQWRAGYAVSGMVDFGVEINIPRGILLLGACCPSADPTRKTYNIPNNFYFRYPSSISGFNPPLLEGGPAVGGARGPSTPPAYLGGLAPQTLPTSMPREPSRIGHDTCILTIVRACAMTIVHACIMIIVHACIMIIAHACTMIIIRGCSMIIVHAL